jgi:hypothetical protein
MCKISVPNHSDKIKNKKTKNQKTLHKILNKFHYNIQAVIEQVRAIIIFKILLLGINFNY